MELLIIGGVIAVVLLLAMAAFYLLQQRRSGTVKAVVGPRTGRPVDTELGEESTEAEEAR